MKEGVLCVDRVRLVMDFDLVMRVLERLEGRHVFGAEVAWVRCVCLGGVGLRECVLLMRVCCVLE